MKYRKQLYVYKVRIGALELAYDGSIKDNECARVITIPARDVHDALDKLPKLKANEYVREVDKVTELDETTTWEYVEEVVKS